MIFSTPQKLKRLFLILSGAVLLVLVAVSIFVGYSLQQNRQRYYTEAENTSRNLAMALENAMWAHFNEVDLSLHRARAEFTQMHSEGRYTQQAFSAYLRSLKERMPQARSVRGADARGMVVYGDDIDLAKPQDLKIREFYQRTTTERELVFGVPVKSRISGEMVFPLALALTYPDGKFGGTAYVLMNNSRLNELISSLDLGAHGVITLIDSQRRLLHRYPSMPGLEIGTKANVAAATAAVLETGARNASYTAVSSVDGEARSYNIERIGDYPVYILVGLSERDFLAPWHAEVRNSVAFLLLLYLLSAALLAGVRVSLQRQRAAVLALLAKDATLQSSMVALTASEARFRSLVEGLPQMAWTTTDARHAQHVSPHWRDFFGIEDKQGPIPFDALMHEEDRAAMRAAWLAALENKGPFRCACRLRRRDGVWCVFDNHALPQHDAQGAIVCWVGSSTDITEQVAANDALRLAKDQALAAGRAKSDFVANMSHEIRSPMNAVLGMLQLLQRTALTVVQRDYAAKAETSAKALLGILNDILDFSKVEEGKLTLDRHPFSVDTMLRELAVILSANANASGKDVEVIFNISAELPRWLEGDCMRLQQVLLNLTGNAIKFTERGEVVLTVTPLDMTEDGIRVAFSVRDTGIGIPAQHLAHIFDGFSQAEASTARRFGGTGLGLAISQRLVGLMGGTLGVSSVEGQGSQFDFTITLGRTAQQSEREVGHALRHLLCLIVDDNNTCRTVLAAMTGMFGWRADTVADGEAALAAVAARRYDVVFIDWRMPGLDGWETCKRIRASGKPQPLLVMVTAHDSALVAKTDGKFAPVLDAMLAKPVTASMLFDTVSNLRQSLGTRSADMSAMATLAATADTSLTGVRLLVVDDNAMNLQVARELLGAVGANVAVADSGHAALELVCERGERFDLVLMDIQMPDQDGFATTAQIQARMRDTAPPVIAMTANAMASDREQALAAGMVDHVGKPFDLEQLIATILRHHGAAAPAVLDGAAALARMGGNRTVYLAALRLFPVELDKLRLAFGAAIDSADGSQASAALHVLRGLAGTVGAQRLAVLVREVEERLQAGGGDAVLKQDLALVLAEMAAAAKAAADAVQA